MSRPNVNVENLERALNEIVALEAIYGCGEVSKDVTEEMMFRNNGGSQFSVLSTSEWEIAQTIIQASSPDFNSSLPQVGLSETNIPALEVEIRITDILDESEKPIESIMRCCLPPGYPDVAAVVNVGPISGLLRSERETISSALNSKAKAMVSQEVILDLVEEVKSLVNDIFAQEQKIATSSLRNGLIEYDRRKGWRGPLLNIKRYKKNWKKDLKRFKLEKSIDWNLAIVKKVNSFFAEIETEDNIKGIIIGNPLNMDGTSGSSAQSVKDTSKNIEKNINLPVCLWDERLSTVGAFNLSSQLDVNVSKREKKIDENAAAFILQGAIDFLNN